jgi:hypothetical protein
MTPADPDVPLLVSLVVGAFRRHGYLPDPPDEPADPALLADLSATLGGPFEDHQILTAARLNLIVAEQRAQRQSLHSLRAELTELAELFRRVTPRVSNAPCPTSVTNR